MDNYDKKMAHLKRGMQVVYVPSHAGGDVGHPDCESGFVTSVRGDVAFCRYWSKRYAGELRTKANSEGVPIENLVLKETVPQVRVEAALRRYCGEI